MNIAGLRKIIKDDTGWDLRTGPLTVNLVPRVFYQAREKTLGTRLVDCIKGVASFFSLDCWQSVFLPKFQQELGENISLKENGTRHWRGTPSSLLGHTAIPLFCVRDD